MEGGKEEDVEMKDAGGKNDEVDKASESKSNSSQENENKDEEEDGEDEEEEEEEEEEKKEPYRVPSRATRGQRMTQLVGDALEADEEFWGQNAWKELSDDEDIGSDEWSSDEKEDLEDSDIDAVDEEAEERERLQQAQDLELQEKRRAKSEQAKRRKGVYVDPALKTSSQQRKKPRTAVKKTSNVVMPSSREMRTSTKVNTIATNHAVHQERKSQRQAKQPAREPTLKLTQQQLLEEAARTEIVNRRSLELMLMFQEEKKRDKTKVEKVAAPRIVYYSSVRGVRKDAEGKPAEPIKHSLTFTHVNRVPRVINAKPLPRPEPPICSVTGLPAKYRDPLTGIPYRTVEAFKVIRSNRPQN